MIVLAADMGTNFGWSVSGAGGPGSWEWGQEVFTVPKGRGPGYRFRSELVLLNHLISTHKPDVMAQEEIQFVGSGRPVPVKGQQLSFGEKPKMKKGGMTIAAAKIAFGMTAVFQMAAEHHRVPWVGVNVSTLKVWAVGNGRAKKPQMVQGLRDRWTELFPGINEPVKLSADESDALWVNLWTRANHGGG